MNGKGHFSEAVYFGTIFKNLARDWLHWRPDPTCKSRAQSGQRRRGCSMFMGLCKVLAVCRCLFLADLTVTQSWTNDQLLYRHNNVICLSAEMSVSGIAMGSVVTGHVTMAIPDAEISAVRFCSYTARHTHYTVRSALLATARSNCFTILIPHAPLQERSSPLTAQMTCRSWNSLYDLNYKM